MPLGCAELTHERHPVASEMVCGAQAAFVHFMVGEWQNFMNFRRKQFKNAVRGSLVMQLSRQMKPQI